MPLCPHHELPKRCHQCRDLGTIQCAASSLGEPSSSSAASSSSSVGGVKAKVRRFFAKSQSLKLPSGLTLVLTPYNDSWQYSCFTVLKYAGPISLPGSSYVDVLPCQMPIAGLEERYPIFMDNVTAKIAEMNAKPGLYPQVPVFLNEGRLWLAGDKHHTFVAALLCQRLIILNVRKIKSPGLSDKTTWKNISFVSGAPRSNITAADLSNNLQ